MNRFATSLAVVLSGAMVFGVVADDKKPASKHPTQEEMMAAMAKMGAVNENHKRLEQMAGEWKAQVQCWMEPGGQPIKSEGACKNQMILGGRFLSSTFEGTMMGQPYNGHQLLGYDNTKGKFFSLWIDNMNTGYMAADGSADPAGKALTFTSNYDCPIKKMPIKMRLVSTMVDNDTNKFEMFNSDNGGPEYKTMEIVYTRVK